MKKNEDEITDLFRSRLNQYEIPLQEDMWEDLERELSNPPSRKLYSAAFVAIAALFLLLVACSAAVWMFTPHKEMSPSLSKVSVPVVERHTAIARTEDKNLNELPIEQPAEPKVTVKKKLANSYSVKLQPRDSVMHQTPSVDNKESNPVLATESQSTEVLADNQFVNEAEDERSWTLGLVASIEGGKSLSSMMGDQQTMEIRHKAPISFGISVGKKITDNITFETGLYYTLLNSELKPANELVDNQKIHYLGIPLKVNWIFMNKNKLNLYLSAGGMLEQCVSGKIQKDYSGGGSQGDEATFSINRMQCSLTSSLGLQYNTSAHVALFAEPGLAYYFDDQTLASTIRKDRQLNFNLRCGVKVMY